MKLIHGWVNGLLVAAMLASGAALAGPPAQTPSALRGVWFEDSSLGEHHCLQYRLRRSGELVPGTLVVSDRLIAEAKQGVQEDLLFLTRVAKLADESWQIEGLLDVYPYEQIKPLRAYGYSVRDSRLLRSRAVHRDGQDVIETQTYVRCI